MHARTRTHNTALLDSPGRTSSEHSALPEIPTFILTRYHLSGLGPEVWEGARHGLGAMPTDWVNERLQPFLAPDVLFILLWSNIHNIKSTVFIIK